MPVKQTIIFFAAMEEADPSALRCGEGSKIGVYNGVRHRPFPIKLSLGSCFYPSWLIVIHHVGSSERRYGGDVLWHFGQPLTWVIMHRFTCVLAGAVGEKE